MAEWIVTELGTDVPVHFTAFHPDFKMTDKPRTPAATLTRAREIALGKGLHYVYPGNVHDRRGSSTYCPSCNKTLIERDWYQLGAYHLDSKGACRFCGHLVAGRFGDGKGNWQGQRRPLYF